MEEPLPLGELAVKFGFVSEEDLEALLLEHERTGVPLGEIMVRRELLTEKQLRQLLALQNLGRRSS